MRSVIGTVRSCSFKGMERARQRWARIAARWPPAETPPIARLEGFARSDCALSRT